MRLSAESDVGGGRGEGKGSGRVGMVVPTAIVTAGYSLSVALSVIAVWCFLPAAVIGKEGVNGSVDLGLGLGRLSAVEG